METTYNYPAILAIMYLALLIAGGMIFYGIWGALKFCFLHRATAYSDHISLREKLILSGSVIRPANSSISSKMESVVTVETEDTSVGHASSITDDHSGFLSIICQGEEAQNCMFDVS